MDIYSQRLEEEILPHLKFYEHFNEKISLEKDVKEITQEPDLQNLKGDLKMSLYRVFSQMIRTFQSLSGQFRDKTHAQQPRITEKLNKFYEYCEEVRKIQQRKILFDLL